MFHHETSGTLLDHTYRPAETALLTLGALIAFAANSIFCKLALLGRLIDPSLFTAVRLLSGATVLGVLCALRRERPLRSPAAGILPALLLFCYAFPFTFAYMDLSVGTGALILFGAVQITMIFAAFRIGHKPSPLEWSGVVLAFGGLIWLTAPGVQAPPAGSSALMAAAGVSWGLYTMRGRRSGSPVADTAGNFILAALPSLIIGAAALPGAEVHADGVWLGVASGALASGLGYALWYRALRGLTPVRAAVVQLAVPVIASAAGVVILSESMPARLLIAGALVIGGIALTIIAQRFDDAGR